MKIKDILLEAIDKGIISVQEYNEGFYKYFICRIVWETKSHYILDSVDTEEEAKKRLAELKSDDYYYEKVKIC